MRNNRLFLLPGSFKDYQECLIKQLYLDLPFYNFNPNEWIIDLSENVDEGHEFSISGIGIVNKKTKEHFGGWSDYIASSDGKEFYIFWDLLKYTPERAEKYGIKEKTEFGVPLHIQQRFSEKLKKEIAEGKNYGSQQFLETNKINRFFQRKNLLIYS